MLLDSSPALWDYVFRANPWLWLPRLALLALAVAVVLWGVGYSVSWDSSV